MADRDSDSHHKGPRTGACDPECTCEPPLPLDDDTMLFVHFVMVEAIDRTLRVRPLHVIEERVMKHVPVNDNRV